MTKKYMLKPVSHTGGAAGRHFETSTMHSVTTMLANDNHIRIEPPAAPHPGIQLALKRIIDVTGSLVGLILLAPFLALIAVLIRIESEGPIFFRQLRTGRDEVPFEILKFRSMYVDRCDLSGVQQTVDGDLRITRVGRILRKTNLDEIPQLWNVLVGHMSLVGPRPHVPDMLAGGVDYAQLVRGYEHRHLMRPGLTGLAQAHGFRGSTTNSSMAISRIVCDIEYIETFSLMLDARIMVRTLINELTGGTGS